MCCGGLFGEVMREVCTGVGLLMLLGIGSGKSGKGVGIALRLESSVQ